MNVTMGGRHAFVMMIQQRWWDEFRRRSREGKKTHSYVQRGAAPPKDTAKILFYVAKPVGQMAGYADFIERKVGEPVEVWKEFSNESVLTTRKMYEEFVKNLQKVSFIRFKNLEEAAKPISLNNLLLHFGVKRLSRKGFYVDRQTADALMALME